MNDRLLGDIPASTPLKVNVRRLNKRPIMIGMTFVMVGVLAAYFAILQAGRARSQSSAQENRVHVSPERMVDDMLAGRPDGIIGDARAVAPEPRDADHRLESALVEDAPGAIAPPKEIAVDVFAGEIQKLIEAERMRIARARREEATKAVLSQSTVLWSGDDAMASARSVVSSVNRVDRSSPQSIFADASHLRLPGVRGAPGGKGGLESVGAQVDARLSGNQWAALAREGATGMPSIRIGQGPDHSDVNRQDLKQAFQRDVGESSDVVINERRVGPAADLEVKAGSVIPATLITGINSDLPGQLVAQVSQNVLDTTHAQAVLIPQGARLIGRYDSQVTYGQERALVIWDRLLFPDGTHLSLRGMAGHDRQGMAGFRDRVNHHYARIFGSAILLSFVQGAIATSGQPADRFGIGASTPGDELRRALALEVGRVSTELIRKNLRIAPTLEIRAGYQFAVMVNKDIVLPPYAPAQALLQRRGRHR